MIRPDKPKSASTSTATVHAGSSNPVQVADYVAADIAAVQAVARGDATPEMQIRALRWIVEAVADTYGLSFRVDPYATAFAEGKRHVGLQIVKATRLNISALRAVEEAKKAKEEGNG